MKALTRLLQRKEAVVVLLIVAIFLVLSLGSETFLHAATFDSLQMAIAPNAIICVGMMVLLASGVFDLSVGSVMGLAGAVASILLAARVPALPSLLAGLGVGAVFGIFNGVLVEYVGVNPLIMTLGTMYIGRGLVNALMRGERRYGVRVTNAGFLSIGQTTVGGVYLIFIVMLVIIVAAQLVMMRTRAGRNLYYIGSNPDAARLVGIKVRRVRLAGFLVCALLAALTGMLMTSYQGTSSLYMGMNLELQIIISCLIGGASIAGGQGNVVGSLLGVVFMTMVVSVFNILEIGIYWQNIVVGLILMAIVSLDALLALRRRRALGEV